MPRRPNPQLKKSFLKKSSDPIMNFVLLAKGKVFHCELEVPLRCIGYRAFCSTAIRRLCTTIAGMFMQSKHADGYSTRRSNSSTTYCVATLLNDEDLWDPLRGAGTAFAVVTSPPVRRRGGSAHDSQRQVPRCDRAAHNRLRLQYPAKP